MWATHTMDPFASAVGALAPADTASPDQSYAAEKEALRRRAFKATIDQEDARRKREDHQIKIRKEKKMNRLQKRRQVRAPFLSLVTRPLNVDGGGCTGCSGSYCPGPVGRCSRLRRSTSSRDCERCTYGACHGCTLGA